LFFFCGTYISRYQFGQKIRIPEYSGCKSIIKQTKKDRSHEKVKIIRLGASLIGMSALGFSYFGASNTEAQGMGVECEWNGQHCKNPTRTNLCGCE
jgi:hypothetical protein